MFLGALICAAVLTWGQASGSGAGSAPAFAPGFSPAFAPPVEEGGTFLPGSPEVQQIVFPDFALPRPTAPPPSPALAAEDVSLPATRFTTTWLSGAAPHGSPCSPKLPVGGTSVLPSDAPALPESTGTTADGSLRPVVTQNGGE